MVNENYENTFRQINMQNKRELAQSIKAHFQSQIPENLTKNPKILRKFAKNF